MKAHHICTVATATALFIGMTACTGTVTKQDAPSSTPSTSAVESTPTAGTTPGTEKSSPVDAAQIRNGIYLDTWAKNISTYIQSTAHVYLYENKKKIAPGDLQTHLDNMISADTPDAFQVEATTTASNNFTIKVWHVNGYLHVDEKTAYIAQSDPAVTVTPSPTPTGSKDNPSQNLDEDTKKVLYEAGVAAGTHMRNNQGALPTDQYMRTNGFIPKGWEWSISIDKRHTEFFLIRVWNPKASLFNSKATAATFSSFPQPDLRPAYNFDAAPFIPIIGFLSPPATTPTPMPTPSGVTGL